ncbi:hypothetical protein ScPMuIL_017126 [Solemya velum]
MGMSAAERARHFHLRRSQDGERYEEYSSHKKTRLYVLMVVIVPLLLSPTTAETDVCAQMFKECVKLLTRHAPGKQHFKCPQVVKRCYARVKREFLRRDENSVFRKLEDIMQFRF